MKPRFFSVNLNGSSLSGFIAAVLCATLLHLAHGDTPQLDCELTASPSMIVAPVGISGQSVITATVTEGGVSKDEVIDPDSVYCVWGFDPETANPCSLYVPDSKSRTATLTAASEKYSLVIVTFQENGSFRDGSPYFASGSIPISVYGMAADFQDVPDRIPPGRDKKVQVTLNQPLPSDEYCFQVHADQVVPTEGAALLIPSVLACDTEVVLRGTQQSWGCGSQSAPRNMQLSAKLSGFEVPCNLSNYFTVCAHPIGLKIYDYSCIDVIKIGIVFNHECQSDSPTPWHLNRVQIKEVVSDPPDPYDNPPFGDVDSIVGGYVYGPYLEDRFLFPIASISEGTGDYKVKQLALFKCDRCQSPETVMPSSGFEMLHHIIFSDITYQYEYHCEKNAKSVTVGSYTSGAGINSVIGPTSVLEFP